MTALADKLAGALADLGDDPDTIAAVLRLQGCRGTRGVDDCPVAVYLQRQIGKRVWVSVVRVGVADDWVLELPAPAMEFVRRFDGGLYPDLEATS